MADAPLCRQSMPSESSRRPGGATPEIRLKSAIGKDWGESGFIPERVEKLRQHCLLHCFWNDEQVRILEFAVVRYVRCNSEQAHRVIMLDGGDQQGVRS